MTEFPYTNWEGEHGAYKVCASSHPLDDPDGLYLLQFEDGTFMVAVGSPANGWFGGFDHDSEEEGREKFQDELDWHALINMEDEEDS